MDEMAVTLSSCPAGGVYGIYTKGIGSPTAWGADALCMFNRDAPARGGYGGADERLCTSIEPQKEVVIRTAIDFL